MKIFGLIIALLCLALTGCIMPKAGFGQAREIRGNGLYLTYQGAGIGLGSFVIKDISYPVGTNQLYSAPYWDAQAMTSSGWSPFGNTVNYATGVGNVQVQTNATGQVIVPKSKPPVEISK